MGIIKKITGREYLVFTIVVILQLIPIFLINFVASMDGPQHLHNSQVLKQLLSGNEAMREIYRINPVVVGYWTGHFLLTLYNFIFPAWLAENFLLATYLIGLAFAFRYLVKAFNPTPSLLTVLIIPFSYTFYFLLGYYTFSLAFIFVFLTFGYYYRHRSHPGVKQTLILFLLIAGVFLSHAFVFALFAAGLAFFVLIEFLFEYFRTRDFTPALKLFVPKVLMLFFASLPVAIFFVIYIRSVMGIDNTVIGDTYDFHERLYFIARIRAIVGFNLARETYANYGYWIVMILVMGYALYRYLLHARLNNWSDGKTRERFFSIRHGLAWVSLLFLIFYFVMPDRISAGNLVSRVAIFFFYFLIAWIATLNIPRKMSFILSIAVLILFAQQASTRYRPTYRLSAFTKEAHYLEQYIEPNSVVFTVTDTSHWIDIHFLNFIGVDKPVINLANPQCSGQFPVVWNHENMPRFMVGTREVTNHYGRNHQLSQNQEIRQVDYVAIYRWGYFEASERHDEMKSILKEYYELVAMSPWENAALFKLKTDNSVQD